MTRPTPLYRIHDTTPIFARLPGQETWTAFSIVRKTARSIFVATPDGALQLDRVALERTGQTKRQGSLYCLVHPALPALEERIAS